MTPMIIEIHMPPNNFIWNLIHGTVVGSSFMGN